MFPIFRLQRFSLVRAAYDNYSTAQLLPLLLLFVLFKLCYYSHVLYHYSSVQYYSTLLYSTVLYRYSTMNLLYSSSTRRVHHGTIELFGISV